MKKKTKKQRQQDAMVAAMERLENEYNQFVAKLNAGEITDVSPYLTLEIDSRYRSKFISRGMFVDECIAFANEHNEAHAHAYRNIKEPNFDELETLLAHPLIVQNRKLRSLRDELQTKFETRHIQLSTIDKTMSVAQLFMANSEGWKRLVNAIQLRQLNQYEKRLRNHPNCEELITEYIQFENYEILKQLKVSC